MPTTNSGLFTIGKDGILWKLDRRTGAFVALRETVHQDIFGSIDRTTGELTYRERTCRTSPSASGCSPAPACWAATTGRHRHTIRAPAPLVIPLHQACMHLTGREVEFIEGAADRRRYELLEMPGSDGNVGKLAAYDVRTMEELWSPRAASAVPDVRADDGGRIGLCR